LVEHDLIAFARMSNGIDRAFARGADGRDANINSIEAIVRALWEFPLS